jgi:hypothetical protein
MGFLSKEEKHEDCFSPKDGKKKKHRQARNQQSNYGLQEKLGSNWQVSKKNWWKYTESFPIVSSICSLDSRCYVLFKPGCSMHLGLCQIYAVVNAASSVMNGIQ